MPTGQTDTLGLEVGQFEGHQPSCSWSPLLHTPFYPGPGCSLPKNPLEASPLLFPVLLVPPVLWLSHPDQQMLIKSPLLLLVGTSQGPGLSLGLSLQILTPRLGPQKVPGKYYGDE